MALQHLSEVVHLELLGKASRLLDVTEQERERSFGQSRHAPTLPHLTQLVHDASRGRRLQLARLEDQQQAGRARVERSLRG